MFRPRPSDRGPCDEAEQNKSPRPRGRRKRGAVQRAGSRSAPDATSHSYARKASRWTCQQASRAATRRRTSDHGARSASTSA